MSTSRQLDSAQSDSPLLLIGIGNCGRQDDGLGWAFLDRLQQDVPFPARFEYRYQLQIEDAALISTVERVIFIDSFRGPLPGGIRWKRCEAQSDVPFTSHILSPESVLYLCDQLYAKNPEAHLLMIQGESWELETNLSKTALANLEAALSLFRRYVLAKTSG